MPLNRTLQPFRSITLAETSPQRIARALAHNSCRLSMPERGHLMEIITYSTTFALPQDVSSQSSGQPLQKSFVIIGESCHKHHFCPDKHVLVTTKVCLLRQKKCRNKHVYVFVMTKMMPVTPVMSQPVSIGTVPLRWTFKLCM